MNLKLAQTVFIEIISYHMQSAQNCNIEFQLPNHQKAGDIDFANCKAIFKEKDLIY